MVYCVLGLKMKYIVICEILARLISKLKVHMLLKLVIGLLTIFFLYVDWYCSDYLYTILVLYMAVLPCLRAL